MGISYEDLLLWSRECSNKNFGTAYSVEVIIWKFVLDLAHTSELLACNRMVNTWSEIELE